MSIKKLEKKKQYIHSLIKYHESISKLHSILNFCDTSKATLKLDVVERAATEFNQLKFHTYCCKAHLSTKEENVCD